MQIEPCKICGNKEFDYLFGGKDRVHYLSGEFKLYVCRACRLILVYPQLTDADLAHYYPDNYYSYGNARRVILAKTRREKLLYYLKHPWEALNCLLYSKLLDLNRDLKVGPTSRILDVGCGDGRYLLEKRQLGCQCYGNDISAAALERLKKAAPDVEVMCGNLWEVRCPESFFDVINLSNVIEHVREVDKLMAEARRIVKPDGLLRIQVPNAASLTFFIFRECWMPLEIPRHVYVFSVSNLKRLFQNIGFEVVSCRTTEGSFTFFASVFFVLASVFRKQIDFMRYERIWDSEILKLLFFPYAMMVNLLRLGDTVEFVLRRKNA